MKRLFCLLCFLLTIIGAKAGVTTTDYMYATGLKYDGRKSMYYFDVCLEGANYYTAYGVDIQLPVGLQVGVINDRTGGKKPNITILNEGMYEDEYGSTEHSIGVSFPYETDFTHARVGCMSNGNYDMGQTSGPLFRVYVTIDYTSNTWPIGAIKLYDVELNKVGAPFDAPVKETIVPVHSGETTLPLNVSTVAKWSTCILPFDAELPEGVTALTSDNYDDENIYLTKAESIKAYTPYVLYSENGYSGTISGTVNTCPENGYVQNGLLCGAIVPQIVKEGFVLQNLQDGVKFYGIGNGSTFNIPAGKCWMSPLQDQSGAKAFNFIISDVTGVNTINTTAAKDDVIYNLQGMKVTTPAAGNIYIRNGKKFATNK